MSHLTDGPDAPRQPGYEAVWSVIKRNTRSWDARDYAVLWASIEAFANAMNVPK